MLKALSKSMYNIDKLPKDFEDTLSTVITIVSLEESDFQNNNSVRHNFATSVGKQLIFVNKDWANNNWDKLALMYPTSLIVGTYVNSGSGSFCQRMESATRINNLVNSNYIVLPISSLPLYQTKLKPVGIRVKGGSIFNLGERDLYVASINLKGLRLTNEALEDLASAFNMPVLSEYVFDLLQKTLQSMENSATSNPDYRQFLSYIKDTCKVNRKTSSEPAVLSPILKNIHDNITKKIFRGYLQSRRPDTSFAAWTSTYALLWVLHQEMLTLDIIEDTEGYEE